ncbi:hypothetical protein [Oscillibacter sp.]|uniref:XAC2610-related protein n=1 Tax=Oscillibacter sp. TaxID=1945593 RepID=UPI00261C6160|nr:hypothetical protein [Oscillibacter sp.]MDD3347501.1 hypothetical protein [Oscillibacter sp.]
MAIGLLLTALLCAGCGAETPSPAPESPPASPQQGAVPAPEATVETEDHVLMTMELPPMADGRTLTCQAIGKKRADADQWGVREIRVYDGEHLLQTLLVQDAIDTDGVSGAVGEGYTDCPLIDELMSAQDMNFDRIPDIALFAWTPAGANIPRYYWLWDESAACFRYGFCLPNAVPDQETEQIVCSTTWSRGFFTEYYAYDPQGALQLVYTLSETYQIDGSHTREAYRLVDGTLVREE